MFETACPRRGGAHEDLSPHGIGSGDDRQRLAQSNRESFFGPVWRVYSKLTMHALQLVHVFLEPPAGFGRPQLGQRLNNWSIALGT